MNKLNKRIKIKRNKVDLIIYIAKEKENDLYCKNEALSN